MKGPVTIRPDYVANGVIELLDALDPGDIAEIAAMGTRLSVFAGIGRALFTAREAAEEYRAATAAPPPATVIDNRSTSAPEPPQAPVQKSRRNRNGKKSRPSGRRSVIDYRLPIERKGNGDAEQNRRKIAALLADRGPMRANELCAELEMGSSIMGYYLNGRPDWFERLEPTNTKSKWNVTAAALAALGADPRPSVPPAGSEPIGG